MMTTAGAKISPFDAAKETVQANVSGWVVSRPHALQGSLGLRARRERPRSRAAESQDELAPSHSMTSSARAGDVGPARKKRAARGWCTNADWRAGRICTAIPKPFQGIVVAF